MYSWKAVLVLSVLVALSAITTPGIPEPEPGPIPLTMLASDGLLPAHVYHAGRRTVAAYQAAIDRPDILASVPCLCGCIEGLDHASNLACYIESSTGGVTTYTSHGLYCVVCQMITEDALAGAALGMDPAALHAMIEEKYGR